MIPSLEALGEALRRAPVAPSSVVDLLERHGAYLAFRQLVRDVFPEAEAEILAATGRDGDRESARVWAFLHKVEAEYFPVYEYDEYEQVLCGIPFVRNAWSYDRFHELDLSPGELLLFALCAQPYESGYDSRVALLDAAEAHVPRALLAELPEAGLTPAELHERLDGTPYAAAAEYADWLWGDTGSVFLDVDEQTVADIEWTRENVLELADHWRLARELLDRTGELARWLEADPAARFERLLAAALGRDAYLEYERMRRFYACEITEHGLLPVPHDEPEDAESLPLPLGAAA
ncbi:MAG: hypothetical protein KatS3mg060_2244 [Dehalococcoidia bacterium]|nr:MAG: hypothetical protein KatS3mg060_2244 [Dehalococcoidia bacterium]